MRIALKFAYDGSNFHGYARQPSLKTVEEELIKAFIKHGFIEDTKECVLRSASRTDKHVSVFGNVIAFNTSASKREILEQLSDEFEDIVVFGAIDVKTDFNPRYARYRNYRYFLNVKNLDVGKIISTSSAFTGEHNFSNFARIEPFKDPVRVIDNIVFSENESFLLIDFYAQTFLWNQIRRIISALEKVGRGKLEKENIVEALCNPDKLFDFGLAPAEYLILKDVVYDFDFRCSEKLLIKLEDLKKRIIKKIYV